MPISNTQFDVTTFGGIPTESAAFITALTAARTGTDTPAGTDRFLPDGTPNPDYGFEVFIEIGAKTMREIAYMWAARQDDDATYGLWPVKVHRDFQGDTIITAVSGDIAQFGRVV